MKLEKLLAKLDKYQIFGDKDIEITSIAFDTGQVKNGSIFFCLKGSKLDGHNFADIAISKGAVAVVCSQDIYSSVTTVKVKDTRQALSIVSSNFYGNPCEKLKIIGVVGTNGKSTTAYIIQQLLLGGGYKCALVGTMYCEWGDKRISSTLTTPDPTTLHGMFKEMVDDGIEYVVMEISAHAIHLDKLYGVKPEICVFTNLSQDHLDYFGTLANYKQVKKSYFDSQNIKMAVINIDDECGREILSECDIPTITYGLDNPADCFAIDYTAGVKGCSYVLNLLDSVLVISTKLYGKFNVYNALASCVVAKVVGVSDQSIISTMQSILPPAGRFNVFHSKGVSYIIDFAHTPDGLFNLLKEGRSLTLGRVIVVFGCGGDRDVSKRPLMGKIASEMADIAVITSDNPRTENRKAIATDIVGGMTGKAKLYVELDRAKAITLAKEIAVEGDVVLIAGKGSENYIDENNSKKPYSDMAQLMKVTEIAIG